MIKMQRLRNKLAIIAPPESGLEHKIIGLKPYMKGQL
jgi:hypothetical protein